MKYGLKFWEHVRNVKNGRNFFKSVFIGGVTGVVTGVIGVIGVVIGVISVEMRH